MSAIVIVDPGMLTTVQDTGRTGHQHDGVSPCGACDSFALRAANLLVGNAPGAAGLEATLRGPTVRFDASALLALGGAESAATLDGREVPRWRPVRAAAGSRLSLGSATGARAYLAVAGGIDVPVVLGSRATDLRARFGGHEGRTLHAGDRLPVGAAGALSARIADAIEGGPVASWELAPSMRPRYAADALVRVLESEIVAALAAEARERIWRAEWRVDAQSDRMGVRLAGAPLSLEGAGEMLSSGVVAGTIQLPPGGAPIVLLADRQTTGGYPRLAEVITADLPLVAQLRPGDRLRFRPVPMADAERADAEREEDLRRLALGIALRHAHARTTVTP